ncbi:MAG: hypothetical protein VW577_03070 [Pelagibacteraceae bacterium]
MVMPIIRSNGNVIYPKSATLPKNSTKNDQYEGTIKVLETFNQKSEVNLSDFEAELAPDRPFVETLDAINKDPRLNLSNETYIQMILGKGLKITAKKDNIAEMVTDWLDEINFDEMIEDGLYSYLGTGNLFYEKSPTSDEFIEIPVHTIKSVVRDKNGRIAYYLQDVNNKHIRLKPNEVIHFKLTNVAREPFGRGLHHSVLADYEDPRSGATYDSPLIQMKKMEHAMPEIFHSYASPLMMFQFEDAGEQFIKTQADALKKAKPGMKIVTDKPFKVEKFEVNGNAKFEGYIEHIQRDLLEPGSKFPLQFFNAGFTARAASESTDSVLIRKVKRIQARFAKQILTNMILPFLKSRGKTVKAKDIQVYFESPQKQELTVQDVITAYRDNGIRRSELRQWLISNSNVMLDQMDMDDEPPITSVTPTNQMQDTRPPENTSIDTQEVYEKAVQDLKMMVTMREELDRAEKKKMTGDIIDFIKELKND